jgi:hypothetical protein
MSSATTSSAPTTQPVAAVRTVAATRPTERGKSHHALRAQRRSSPRLWRTRAQRGRIRTLSIVVDNLFFTSFIVVAPPFRSRWARHTKPATVVPSAGECRCVHRTMCDRRTVGEQPQQAARPPPWILYSLCMWFRSVPEYAVVRTKRPTVRTSTRSCKGALVTPAEVSPDP